MERKDGTPKQYNKSEKTKKKIMTALVELLDSRPLDSVTIQEICERADVHRTTFYKHYGSVFDVINAVSDEICKAFADLLGVVDKKEQWFDFLAEFIVTYRGSLSNLNKTKYKELVISPLAVVLYEFYHKLYEIENTTIPEGFKMEWIIRYHIAGTLAIAEHWLLENATREECRQGIEGMYKMIFNRTIIT